MKKFFGTIIEAVKICFSEQDTMIDLKEEEKPKIWHRGACNMDPHDVAKMVPPEIILKRRSKKSDSSFRKIKPTKVRP